MFDHENCKVWKFEMGSGASASCVRPPPQPAQPKLSDEQVLLQMRSKRDSTGKSLTSLSPPGKLLLRGTSQQKDKPTDERQVSHQCSESI